MTFLSIVQKLLILAVLASHSFLSVADFFGLVKTADFFVRTHDGSRANPEKLLPVESAFVTMVGLPHFVIVLCFLSALVGQQYITVFSSAFVSVVVHGVWAAHLLAKKAEWVAMFHKESNIDWNFFFYAHFAWFIVSLIIMATDTKPIRAVRLANKKD